jgi:Ca2+-binding EF-hand superfamily protein
MLFVVGVYITQFVADHARSDPQKFYADAVLQKYYGSLGSSVLSLFQALSGGVDWEESLTPLQGATSWRFAIAVFYSIYIAFSMFVMLNLITGIFVDSAQTNIREDKDMELVNRVRELFTSADDDHSGQITWDEFEGQLATPQMEEYFKVIDLDLSEAKHLFTLLDTHSTGSITSDEFVNGCLRLRGSARAFDLTSHICWSKQVFKKMINGVKDIQREVRAIAEEMDIDLQVGAEETKETKAAAASHGLLFTYAKSTSSQRANAKPQS